MNRPKSALAALVLSVVIVAPTAAQQVPLTPQPPMSEFCSGCFAYLEFPPLAEAEAPSGPAYTRQDAPAPTAAKRENPIAKPALGLVASAER